MPALKSLDIPISESLLEAIRFMPVQREVSHCGQSWGESPLTIYANCPQCGQRIKLRAFAAQPEIEDVFDAVFVWLNQPGSQKLANSRILELEEDK